MTLFDDWLAIPELTDARFSSIFRSQFEALSLARVINPFSILNELKALEHPSRFKTNTKKAAPFRGGDLHGLMHKHFHLARNLALNIRNEWGDRTKMERIISKSMAESESSDPWLVAGKIADRMVKTAYEHKNLGRSLTGDWIIYKLHSGKTYYLCLAGHDEDTHQIALRLQDVAVEFPDLTLSRRDA